MNPGNPRVHQPGARKKRQSNRLGLRMGRFAPIWDQDPADWQWALNVNVLGIANMLRAFVPRLRAQEPAAHIVNTARQPLNSSNRDIVTRTR